jgi:homoserine kinase
MIRVRVPASTSNLGAGFDCLGLALDLWLEIRVMSGAGPDVYRGTLAGLDPAHDIVASLVRDDLGPDRHLEIASTVPVARGLGSSAAAHVGALVLHTLLHDRDPDLAQVFSDAADREGHPDNAGPAVYGGLILSTDRPERLALSDQLGIALAIPNTEVRTSEARAVLPDELARDIAIAQASGAAALLLGLTTGNGDLIGFGMDDRIATPHRRHLIPGFEDAVAAGKMAGAYGVTISGAGPTMLAITDRRTATDVATAMADALVAAGNSAAAAAPAVNSGGVRWEV